MYSEFVFYNQIEGILYNYRENIEAWTMGHAHYHNCYEFMYIMEGRRKLILGEREYFLRKGDLLILPPHLPHKTGAVEPGDLITRSVFHFSAQDMGLLLTTEETEELLKNLSDVCIIHFEEPQRAFYENFQQRVSKHLDRMDRFGSKLVVMDIASMLLSINEIPKEQWTEIKTERNGFRREILDALQYITDNYRNPDLSLEETSSYVYMSRSRFSTLFKESTGLSFLKYLNAYRNHYVMYDLSFTDLTLQKIAVKNGYVSVAQMSRNFTSVFGCTPSQYRTQHPYIRENQS